MGRSVQLEAGWKERLQSEFDKEYMINLRSFLAQEAQKKKIIYPKGSQIFAAFNHTPFDNVKVVIVGQDPYHGPGQAHGLCFSVGPHVPIPPSLMNIYQEIRSDLGYKMPNHGHLISWAEQGVLLLNAVLTVEKSKAASHNGRGWEEFTDKVIEILNEQKEGLVFVLWGSFAQKKGASVDPKRHLVLKAPHPSPLSAYRGFLGCRHFSQINRYLKATGKGEIDWRVPELD